MGTPWSWDWPVNSLDYKLFHYSNAREDGSNIVINPNVESRVIDGS